MATHNVPGGHNVERPRAYLQKPAAETGNAMAYAPMSPVRPTDLDAMNALASPPGSADDATFDALIRQGGSPLATPPVASLSSKAPMTPPQGSAMANPTPVGSATMRNLTVDTPQGTATLPSTPAQSGAMANPPGPDPGMSGAAAPVYAADPGAAQRAALYRQLNPTGSPIGVPPATAPRGPTLASVEVNPFADLIPPQPLAPAQAPQIRLTPTDEQPANGGWQSAPLVNPFNDLIPAAPQGNAANWGPTTEILNGAMMGTLPQAEGWVSNHCRMG